MKYYASYLNWSEISFFLLRQPGIYLDLDAIRFALQLLEFQGSKTIILPRLFSLEQLLVFKRHYIYNEICVARL